MEQLGIGNFIGIGMCMFAFIGFTPFIIESLGGSLELGIIIASISTPIIFVTAFYLAMK